MNVTVVILNWNRPDDSLLAVKSVLRQTHASFEVLVWDNGSSDQSRAVLETHFRGDSRVRFIWADDNYGVAGGRNRAFAQAEGKLLISLDSDAVFESEEALATIVACFQERPTVGAVSFEVKRPDGHLMWPFSRPAADWRHQRFETIRVDGCAFAMRQELFKAAKAFPEHFSPYGAEDQYFAYQVIGLGSQVLYLPDVVVVHAFAEHGRNPLQFARHVRNSLWIPMELFPFPQALLSVAKLKLSLFRDAMEQHQVRSFIRGVFEALFGFRWSRRQAIPRHRWHHLRSLVAEDKRLGAGS